MPAGEPPRDDLNRRASVADLDAARRQQSTRLIADANVVLVTILGLSALAQRTKPVELGVIAGCLLAYGTCSVLARRGRPRLAASILVGLPLVSSLVTVLQNDGSLGPAPYFLGVALLFAAATLTLRGVLLACMGALISFALMVVHTRGSVVESTPHEQVVAASFALLLATGLAAALLAATMRSTLSESLLREKRALVAEARAVEGEELLRLFADHTDDLISLVDEAGAIVYASPSYERVLGMPPTSIVGKRQEGLIHPDDRSEAARGWREAMERGRATMTVRVVRPRDGAVRWLEAVLNVVERTGTRYVAIAARDVTKQRLLSEQLQQAQKMDALGRLAGGVAHDFNNLLAIIQASTAMAAAASSPEEARALLDEALMASKRAGDLTRQLLTFSRGEVQGAFGRVDLPTVLRDAASLAKRLVGPNVEIVLEVPHGLWSVRGTGTQIEQVLLNLASNARDAMPEGGTLRISARNRPADGAATALTTGSDAVEIVVSDTGVGMTEEALSHAFEPFFTTKRAGAGTGLGLATCYGIVEQLRGTIAVASVPNKGTTFTIVLPRALEGDAPDERHAPAAAPAGRRGTVLVVDDDDAVRALMARVVASHGHVARTARNVAEASSCARAEPIDLVLTDLLLGEESGFDVLRAVREVHPHAGAVLTSGYVKDTAEVARHVAEGAVFLPKPFAPDALGEAIHRALGRRRAPESA